MHYVSGNSIMNFLFCFLNFYFILQQFYVDYKLETTKHTINVIKWIILALCKLEHTTIVRLFATTHHVTGILVPRQTQADAAVHEDV